jgi:hypothetical protein
MKTLPAIKVANAGTKVSEITGIVTVGPESAARLSKELGREVLPGEQFDLGTLAYYHKNPIKRLWRSWRAGRKHLFSNPS